jgi:hypothetical protein
MATKPERATAIVEAVINRQLGAGLQSRLLAAFGWRLPPEATMVDKADALIETVRLTLQGRLDQFDTAQAVAAATAAVAAQNAADMAESP